MVIVSPLQIYLQTCQEKLQTWCTKTLFPLQMSGPFQTSIKFLVTGSQVLEILEQDQPDSLLGES